MVYQEKYKQEETGQAIPVRVSLDTYGYLKCNATAAGPDDFTTQRLPSFRHNNVRLNERAEAIS